MVSDIALATDFAIIVVVAAAIGLLAYRSGQPTIIAYIVTGLLIGPAGLQIIGITELTETMAELGLAFLLFLLGIKMRLEDIRHVLRPIVAISMPQMALVALVGTATAYALGFDIWVSIIVGLAVMYSSTAVVIKMLTDQNEATSLHGKIDVGVLLVQDIVVVILLAVLAAGQPDDVTEVAVTLGTVLALVALIGVVALAASRYLLPYVFRRIADNKEVFFLITISWAFLFVFFAEELNLSIEMGAFLAGLAVAQLPYSKELQDRVNPLTDLFILVFFVSVGLELTQDDLLAFWAEALVAGVVLMVAKFLIFFYLIDWQEFSVETTFLGSINMIQVSEFGLVVGAAAVAGGFIEADVLGFLTLLALFTMSVSVYIMQYNRLLFERVEPYLIRFESESPRSAGQKEYRNHAVVIGYDETTRQAIPRLRDAFADIVVVDRTVAHIEELEAAGYDTIYGYLRHGKIRKDAGLKDADFVLSSTVERDVNLALLEEVGPEATVFVEARNDEDTQVLYDAGAHYVIRSSTLAAERLSRLLELYAAGDPAFEEAIAAEHRLLRRADHASDNGTLLADISDIPGGESDD